MGDYAANSHFFTRPDNSQRDFAPVGNQYLPKHTTEPLARCLLHRARLMNSPYTDALAIISRRRVTPVGAGEVGMGRLRRPGSLGSNDTCFPPMPPEGGASALPAPHHLSRPYNAPSAFSRNSMRNCLDTL